jgi:hypothetical protein
MGRLGDMTDEPTQDRSGGMETGSEHGAPGEHLPEPPLTDEERGLLDELRRPAAGTPLTAVEDSPAAVESAEADTPLPADGGDADYPDSARFRAPGE